MEKEFNGNRRSFRSDRSEGRKEYGTERRERRVRFDGSRYDAGHPGKNYGRDGREGRERNFDKDRSFNREWNYDRDSRDYRRERPSRFDAPRKYRSSDSGSYRDSSERYENRSFEKRGDRLDSGKRPRIFRREREENVENTRQGQAYPRVRAYFSDKKRQESEEKRYGKKKVSVPRLIKKEDENAELRLNRYISMGGVCSRREADELIVAGRVKVNGVLVQTVGTKVQRKDKVEVDDVQVFPEKKVYLVLNKPKDCVTTVDDPLERRTVMDLVKDACEERIYPIGRLDRQTMGVLLFTNDGDLAKKLTHPKYECKKIYHVFLDRPLEEADLNAISNGVELEDGLVKADDVSYASPDCMEVGIEIHSGKNRVVRRIFEHLGYQIVKLDRVYFAGITKKGLPRGTWRLLTPREVNMLKVY